MSERKVTRAEAERRYEQGLERHDPEAIVMRLARAIDLSPFLLWGADELCSCGAEGCDDAIGALMGEQADSPQARRTQVLVAEAAAAGMTSAALVAICVEWSRVALRHADPGARSAIARVIEAASDVMRRGEMPHAHGNGSDSELGQLLDAAVEIADAEDARGVEIALALHGAARGALSSDHLCARAAWSFSAELLVAIANTAGEDAEDALRECAAIARKHVLSTWERVS